MNTFSLYKAIKVILLFIPAFVLPDSNAQITAPNADKTVPVTYPVFTGNDKAFVFFSPPEATVTGSLTATYPFAGLYNFDWSQYNTGSGNFDIPKLSQSAVSQSILSGLNNGGYRVRVWNGSGTDTTLTAWVHVDKLFTTIKQKDNQDRLLQSQYTCDYLTLSGEVTIDTFYYFDPVSHAPVRLKNGFKFLWTSDNTGLFIPNKDKVLDPNTTYLPPYLDTWYILTATDSFGMADIDSVFYESNQVKPGFSFKAYDKDETRDFIDADDPFEGDAPMTIKFLNETINGSTYEWIFSDSLRSGINAGEFTSDLNYQPEYTYKIPGGYYPALVGSSEEGCIDTFRLEDPLSPSDPAPLTVLPSLLEVPNVFSPDGNGINDYFTVKFQSMKEFSLRIFDRAGELVYKAEITDMYLWEGWDGNVLDSKRPASPGAYYYVIDATGWDQEHYHKGQYRGVVYLFRE